MSAGRFANLGADDAAGTGGGGPAGARRRPASAAPARDAGFYHESARNHALAGRLAAALRDYSAAIGDNPRLLAAWTGYLWTLLDAGEFADMGVWVRKARDYFPDNPEISALDALRLWRSGQRAEARVVGERAAGDGDGGEIVFLMRGEMELARRGGGDAGLFFAQAARRAPGKGWAHLRVGLAYLAARRPALALDAFAEATRALPEAARGWYGLGLAQRARGQPRAAAAAFAEARRLAPDIVLYARPPAPGLAGRIIGWWRLIFG